MTISNDIGIYDVVNPKIKEKIFPELGNSKITEPDIILPIYNVNDLSNSTKSPRIIKLSRHWSA